MIAKGYRYDITKIVVHNKDIILFLINRFIL
jgi:hypothetical protein